MILLKKIKIKNFLSHDNTEIKFEKDSKFCIVGKSGSGKSAVIEAFLWCLFGEARSNNKYIIKRSTARAIVTVQLEENGIVYEISRLTAKNGDHKLEINKIDGKKVSPMPLAGIREKEDWIANSFLKSTYELFINSVFNMQDNNNGFMSLSPARKKDIVLEPYGVGGFDKIYKRINEKIAEINSEITRNENSLKLHSAVLSEHYKEKQRLEGMIQEKDYYLEICKELEKQATEIEKLSAEKEKYDRLQEKKIVIKTLLSVREEQLGSYKELLNTDYSEIREKFEDAKKESKKLKEELNTIHNLKEELKKNNNYLLEYHKSKTNIKFFDDQISYLNNQLIDKIKRRQHKCPDGKHCICYINLIECDSELIEKELENLMDKNRTAKEEYDKLEEGIKKVSEKIESIEELLKKADISSLESRYDGALYKIMDYKTSLRSDAEIESFKNAYTNVQEEYVKLIEDDKEIDLKLSELGIVSKTDIEKKLAKYNGKKKCTDIALAMITQNEKTLKELHSKIDDNEKKFHEVDRIIKQYSESKIYFEHLKDAFGPNGIKVMLVNKIIPIFEERINKNLSLFTDFSASVETSKESLSSEEKKDGLFVNIYNDEGEEFDFNNYSGGQKIKISLAISEALASLLSIGFRIYDETFIGFDEETTENFAEVLSTVKSNCPQIVCISHIKNISDTFDHRLTVENIKGNSRIINV